MARDGWSREFDWPVTIDGAELTTLRQAIAWLAKLPKSRHLDDDVQLAARLITWSAEEGGIILMAQWALQKVVNAEMPRPAPEPRQRRRAKAYRIIGDPNAKKAPPPRKGKRGLKR